MKKKLSRADRPAVFADGAFSRHLPAGRKRRLYSLLFCFLPVLFLSCHDDDDDTPFRAGIFYSIADRQVAFTALTLKVDSWQWDFGDDETSTEKDPVHTYEEGGTYTVTLVASGSDSTATVTASVSIDLSPFEMLTGGSDYPDGKTWKISSTHSSYDAICLADADLTSVLSIPEGALSLYLGLGEEYEDEFTFKSDTTYSHDTKNGGALTGLVYATVARAEIITATSASTSYGLCIAAYTPETDATFTFTEGKDYTLEAVNTGGSTLTEVTYGNVTTLGFSGNEFIGLMDFTREVIVQELTVDKMRLVMFMAATSGAYYSKPAYAIIFTFEPVD